MKKIASVLLLPLLLAACGTSSAPQSADHSLLGGAPVAAGQDYVQAFEAKVQSDLKALGLDGDLSAQAVAPKSYLNVLRMSDSTARAYIKTTYPAETGCTVDWGDSSTTGAATPTPTNIASEQQNHEYQESGTYAIKLTCGTDVKTVNFTATVITALDLFDTYSGPLSYTYPTSTGNFRYDGLGSAPYLEKGFNFVSEANFMMKFGGGLPTNHTSLLIRFNGPGSNGTINATNNATFNLKTLTANALFWDAKITAYDSSNIEIGSSTFSNRSELVAPVETRVLNWNNVKYIKVTGGGFGYLNLDDMSATINR
ncbi:hypothetical protein GO986_19940 [Deinococcus sp. HMF7620]|uniref:PKD domain-containing protein n=1 Tax=Deinococcus arboris TaxID=2682977 RepID=A0A7C9I1X5_9DEIO|nr:hypothetical protein [Deinococcus arboris]MVN89015.1 hypothetical protein [Deinococcus arboris]